MKRWVLWVVIAAAIVGGLFSLLSTTQHLRIQREGLEQQSFCAISETINCDIVNASSYSEFLGVPIAWWGLCYYALLLGMAVFALRTRKDPRATVAVAWFLSCGGILYSAFLAYIAAVVLGVVCIECLSMYAANILLFVFLFIALGVKIGALPLFIRDYLHAALGRPSNLGFPAKIVRHAIAVAAVFGIGWIAFLTYAGQRPVGEDKASLREKVRAFQMQSLHEIKLDPSWPVWGNPDAKVTIVEFSDYQCPFCRLAAFSLKPYLQEFRRDVRLIFVNYPLDNACNDAMKGPMHPYACFAAKASLCGAKQGDFWGFHDALFRNQRGLNEEEILKIAEKEGMSREEASACIASPEIDRMVRDQIESARAIYLTGTPTIFVNGRKLKYWRDPKYVQAVVREEIERAKKGLPLPTATVAPAADAAAATAPQQSGNSPAAEPAKKP